MRSCSAMSRSICGARPRRRSSSPSLSTLSPSQPPRTTWDLWDAWLKPEPAGGPFTLTVRGSSELTRSDLLVGDVWFASGQSNMEMPLGGFPPQAHITTPTRRSHRLICPRSACCAWRKNPPPRRSSGISAAWQPCTPATAKDFSAVAYFFAREISRREHVAIGVIDSSWGGTPIDAWISLDGTLRRRIAHACLRRSGPLRRHR